ncbi:unnamed protein product [Paramecium octaurelia]|uniref:Transmembrane protein n=1 Tax=Paramecium octaurelia TaxID=43137 RepID=A0A8S1X2W8_PAROT|nr:unnamed protein product [Paramecium octaurelia]
MTEIKEKLFNTKNVKHYQDMCLQQALVLKEKQIFISKYFQIDIQILQLKNTTSVTVDIFGNYENDTQLGYQIILGVDGSLKNQMIPTSLINLQAKITNLNPIILLLIAFMDLTLSIPKILIF